MNIRHVNIDGNLFWREVAQDSSFARDKDADFLWIDFENAFIARFGQNTNRQPEQLSRDWIGDGVLRAPVAAFDPKVNGEPDQRRKEQREELEPKIVQDEGAQRHVIEF